jgi:hypothetical protein
MKRFYKFPVLAEDADFSSVFQVRGSGGLGMVDVLGSRTISPAMGFCPQKGKRRPHMPFTESKLLVRPQLNP